MSTDGPEGCFRLIYRSRSLLGRVPGGTEAGLAEILRVSRAENGARGITGALVLYEEKDRFAQVLEGAEDRVRTLFDRIAIDPRHEDVETIEAAACPDRLFRRWAMALVLEHREPDVPLVATTGGLSEAAPWRVTSAQERVLTTLRDLSRGYGRSY